MVVPDEDVSCCSLIESSRVVGSWEPFKKAHPLESLQFLHGSRPFSMDKNSPCASRDAKGLHVGPSCGADFF